MEGVKVDEGDVLACATSEVGQIDAQMVKLNDSKEKNVKKWKRAAWAWSKSQILGKASSPLQRMLLASQKINKSPRRKNGSLGKQLPVSKSRQQSSPKISAGEQDNGNSQSMEISYRGLGILDVLCGISSVFNRDQLALFVVILWSIWGNRNVAIHGGFVRDAFMLYSWVSLAWCPPSIGCLKLNSNVAIRDCFGAVGVGVAIRDLVGDIVAAASKVLPGSFSAEVGEFLALREGLILAKSFSLSLSVASSLYKEVDDIKALYKEVGNCCCMAIPHFGNRLAHVLASAAFSSGVDQSWSHVAKDCFFAV
ncbi:hypothetical protein ACOSP7_022253 [Xanthoceras sorbifolium]